MVSLSRPTRTIATIAVAALALSGASAASATTSATTALFHYQSLKQFPRHMTLTTSADTRQFGSSLLAWDYKPCQSYSGCKNNVLAWARYSATGQLKSHGTFVVPRNETSWSHRPLMGLSNSTLVAITERQIFYPAQGIKPAYCKRSLVARALSGKITWRVSLPQQPSDSDDGPCREFNIQETENSRFVMLEGDQTDYVVRLSDGKIATTFDSTAHVFGDTVIRPTSEFGGDGSDVLSYNPTTNTTVNVSGTELAHIYDALFDSFSHTRLMAIGRSRTVILVGSQVNVVNMSSQTIEASFAWSDSRISSALAYDSTTDVLFIQAGNDTSAFQLANRQSLWTHEASICAAGFGFVTLIANSQLAVLNSVTGTQRNFSSSDYCSTANDSPRIFGKFALLYNESSSGPARMRRVLP